MLAVGSEVSSEIEVPWVAEDRKAAREHLGGQVVLWNLALEAYRIEAGTVANRNLTREEWGRFFPDRPYHATFADLPVPPP